MKIDVFEISSKEDKVYKELLEQYKRKMTTGNHTIFPTAAAKQTTG
jgi:hypothetical protein